MVTIPRRPPDLPDYERPPVDEVVLSIEFQRLDQFGQAHLGLLWNEIQADYPKTEDHPPLFDIPIPPIPQGGGPITMPAPMLLAGSGFRTWFISEDDSYVLQVQHDRLIHNWRHKAGEYPRFEFLLERFFDHYERLERVTQRLGSIVPVRIEVTYINWITDLPVHEFFIPSRVPATTSAEISDFPAAQQWNAQYEVSLPDAPGPGSLTIQCGSATRPAVPVPEQGTQFLLTFKAPVHPDEQGMVDTMALGRNAIVWTFTDLTDSAAHESWLRRQ
jgi:uncharacterized protein (TIGR04255 family)